MQFQVFSKPQYKQWRQLVASTITMAQRHCGLKSLLQERNNKRNNDIQGHCRDVIRRHCCGPTITSFPRSLNNAPQWPRLTIIATMTLMVFFVPATWSRTPNKPRIMNINAKMNVYYDAAPCRLVETDRSFRGACCFIVAPWWWRQ
jgi:hypothetical protein